MRILLVITGLSLGGAEVQLGLLAATFRRMGHDVFVVSLISPNAFAELFASERIEWVSLEMRRGKPSVRALREFAGHVKKFRPDVVHSHMIHANLFARMARLFCKIPFLVCTAHSVYEIKTDERVLRGGFRDLMYRISDPLCDLTTHISRIGLERYRSAGLCPKEKSLFVPNGIDTDRFGPSKNVGRTPRNERPFRWLAVGRLDPAKDYVNLLTALSRLGNRSLQLSIAGAGDELERLQQLTRELGIEPVVHFLGRRQDIPDLMAMADAFVLSSFYEGSPLVLLEAHASGLPVVATNVGGIPDIVLEGETGFLVPAKDPIKLSQAMGGLMDLPENRLLQMGENGRAHVVKNHSISSVANNWLGLYNRKPRARNNGKSAV